MQPRLGSRVRPRHTLRALLAGTAAALVLAPAAGAQEAASGPTVAIVHQVDATERDVVVSVLTDDVGVTSDRVALWENETLLQPVVAAATASGRTAELVFVVDTSERLAPGGAFESLKAALAEEIRSLPEGTRVGVVAAGDLALVRQALTPDLDAAADAVTALRLGTTSALWDAISRGTAQFSAVPDRIRTVVAVSSSGDGSTTATATMASSQVLRAGAQLVAVRYRGGEPALTGVASGSGGVVYGVEDDASLLPTVDRALDVARDRLLLTYPSTIEVGQLAEVEMTLGALATSFSFTGGARFDRLTSLAPVEATSSFTIPVLGAVFSGQLGLYLALVLAVAGVGLAIWSLGSMVLRGDEELAGLLDRYASDHRGAPEQEGDGGIGQTAFVKRALVITENLARDRGVLVKTERLLEKGDVPLRPAEALFLYGVAVVVVMLLSAVLTQHVLAVVLLTAIGALLPVLFVKFKTARRFSKFEAQLPDALQLLAGTLRAGYSLPQGLEAVSHEIEDPMGVELRRVMSEARLGRELEEALESAAARLDSPDFAWAVMAVGIQREVGGNLNELLLTVSETMVARSRLRGEVRALTAEGKMSAIILGGLPPALGGVMWIMNPDYINTLFNETIGQIFIALAMFSGTIGMLWMKKVITIDV